MVYSIIKNGIELAFKTDLISFNSLFNFNILNEKKKTLIGISKFNLFYLFLNPLRDDRKGKILKVNKQKNCIESWKHVFSVYAEGGWWKLHLLP